MNLHAVHVINDRLQASIQAEDLGRIQLACLDIMVECTMIERANEREKLLHECQTSTCRRGTAPDANPVPGKPDVP